MELLNEAPWGQLYGIGLLGATGSNPADAEANRLLMIERRILRIEELLRRTLIGPESIPLPPENPNGR